MRAPEAGAGTAEAVPTVPPARPNRDNRTAGPGVRPCGEPTRRVRGDRRNGGIHPVRPAAFGSGYPTDNSAHTRNALGGNHFPSRHRYTPDAAASVRTTRLARNHPGPDSP